MASPAYSLNRGDLIKIAEGAAIAAAGAVLTYISTTVLPSLHPTTAGEGLIFMVLTTIVHVFLKFFTDTRPPTT